ncbi:deoxyribonuclease gamma [Betta splendens]|uniref:Deoxyribonuclease n=1 Tax=Betta splendens TaxID=158456 RepID=A0A6P7MNE9_BETSP|nr:deoxyribonuclease gamma [Betta splendens]XP_055365163.1 deoxyribonuclease gamma [Betta splendens]
MKIASFNIQRFGKNKVEDPKILDVLIKTVSQYDIILILEVVDSTAESVQTFLDALNKSNEAAPYTKKLSRRLGQKTYKEQFLFLYRDAVVKLDDSYQFDDVATKGKDVFQRDPFILKFTCHKSVLKDLVLIPVHTKPEGSEKELDELYDVTSYIMDKWKTKNIMILGDFNADGAFVTKKEMKAIRIRTDKNFHWLIEDDVDTTASDKNDNTYDRIVVYGDDLFKAVVPNSAKSFNFQKAFKLTNEQALKVSDHYPVEVELK